VTIGDALTQLAFFGKPVSVRQFYRYCHRLGIQPFARTCPAIYPNDTAQRILGSLGLVPDPDACPNPDCPQVKEVTIPTMSELRKIRAQAAGTKGGS
jgi:hypothetical protein